MKNHPILRIAAKALIPFIMLFAFYVQFHGDYGPGGGFQAGVIFASAFVLYALVFGLKAAQEVAPPKLVQALTPVGVLMYAGTGVWCMVEGGAFLDYNALSSDPHHPQHGQHLGILLIEGGVGLTVAAVMLSLFYLFAQRPTLRPAPEDPR